MQYTFDLKKLAKDFSDERQRRTARSVKGMLGKPVDMPLSLRDAAKEMDDVKPATLSRLERALACPDMGTLLAVCSWMKKSPCLYFKTSGRA